VQSRKELQKGTTFLQLWPKKFPFFAMRIINVGVQSKSTAQRGGEYQNWNMNKLDGHWTILKGMRAFSDSILNIGIGNWHGSHLFSQVPSARPQQHYIHSTDICHGLYMYSPLDGLEKAEAENIAEQQLTVSRHVHWEEENIE
jgi:hypothetical protein